MTQDKVLSARVGRNEHVFPDILSLYGFEGMQVTDVTYGAGNFWRLVDVSKYKLLATDLSSGTDCRRLPYRGEMMDMVILDPPYIYNPSATVKDSLSSSYRVNETENLRSLEEVMALYGSAMAEARRVLKKDAILVVKCQDSIQSGRSFWGHIDTFQMGMAMGLVAIDLFVLVQETQPVIRWEQQHHARKNHSYFWVMKKRKR